MEDCLSEELVLEFVAGTLSAVPRGGRTAAVRRALAAHRYFFAEDGLALVASALLSVHLAERALAEELVTEPYAQLGYLAGAFKLRSLSEAYFAVARRGAEARGDMLELATVLTHEALYLTGDGRLDAASGAAERALAGHRALARWALRHAQRTAEALGMPHEAAQAARALSDLAAPRRTR